MKTLIKCSNTKVLALLFFFGSIVTVNGITQTPVDRKGDTGKITGRVLDAETGETIIGAHVVITGTVKGDVTDLDGRFAILGVSPGTYSITVSYISYLKKTITGIDVAAGRSAVINVSLQQQAVGMDEIVVTAEATRNNEAGLLAIQRKAMAVQDGLSAEFISKVGDGNVASAMKRVTGVTMLNGKDVYVRGLGNRYSNIQLNGSPVPSTSSTKKEAPIDLLNSGLVNNIIVQKTYTANQPGEFSGGSVQITTKEFPENENLSFSYSTSYNTLSSFNSTISYNGSTTDFLGFDNGKRSLPPLLKSERVTLDNRDAVAYALHRDWTIANGSHAMPSQKIELSYASQFNESKLPVGVVSNFSYKYDRSFQPNRSMRVIQSYNAGAGQSILNADYTARTGKEEAALSGMLNVFLKPSSTTKVGFKNLYSNSLDNSATVISGDYINYPRGTRQTVADFDRRAIYSSSIVAESVFPEFFESRLKGNVGYSSALRDRPDRRTTQYNYTPQNQLNIYFDDNGNSHFFSRQLDKNYSAQVDYDLKPFHFVVIKTGGFMLFRERDFNARRLEYQDFTGRYPAEMRSADPEEALSPELVADGLLEMVETTQSRDSYTGEQVLTAAYISAEWTLIDRLTLETGLRIEQSDQEVTINDRNQDPLKIADVDTEDYLPAANITYHISSRTNLRGAYSVTLARPEFREISDFRFQDFVGSQIVYGNPRLNRTQIRNYDIRFETYPNPGEFFAVSAFYKKFSDPIELFYRFTERTEVQYKNAREANLYGLELEARKDLTPFLQVVANGSYILSETVVKEEDQFRVANIKRPMYGQSPYTINLGVFYAIPSRNIDLSLNYNTFGPRVVTVGMKRQPDDEYEQPFHKLDFGVKYRAAGFTLKAGVENLLNDSVEYKQGNVVTNKYDVSMTFNFGISYSI